MRSRILFLSGHQEDARKLSAMLEALPLTLEHLETLAEARVRLQKNRYDVVLTSSKFDDGNWVDVLHLVREHPRKMKLIVTDPHADARFWAEVLNLGAYDVLAQPFDEPEVRRILLNACSKVAAMAAV